jgi:hypothetical protein
MADDLRQRYAELVNTTASMAAKLWQRRTELDALNEQLARVRALHQPTVITDWQPCEAHLTASRPRVNHCTDCVLQPITVCAQTSCEGWPCPTARALDGEDAT